MYRGINPSPIFLLSCIFLLIDCDHDDNDAFDASWDPHHMPLPIPPQQIKKQKFCNGTHKNVGDHAFFLGVLGGTTAIIHRV